MSEPKWTKGPWAIHVIRHHYFIGRPKSDNVKRDGLADVAVSIDGRELTDEAEARVEANAHLIAAAPELYEALVAVLDARANHIVNDDPSWWDDAVPKAEAALARARGESDE